MYLYLARGRFLTRGGYFSPTSQTSICIQTQQLQQWPTDTGQPVCLLLSPQRTTEGAGLCCPAPVWAMLEMVATVAARLRLFLYNALKSKVQMYMLSTMCEIIKVRPSCFRSSPLAIGEWIDNPWLCIEKVVFDVDHKLS